MLVTSYYKVYMDKEFVQNLKMPLINANIDADTGLCNSYAFFACI